MAPKKIIESKKRKEVVSEKPLLENEGKLQSKKQVKSVHVKESKERSGGGKIRPVHQGSASGSGPRHTRIRGIDASVRRERDAERQRMRAVEVQQSQFEHPYFEAADVDFADTGSENLGYEEADDLEGSDSADASSFVVSKVRKGRDGRFVMSGSTSGGTRRSGLLLTRAG